MQGKLYITDEGFGPIVRQSAIIEELKLIKPELKMILQTQKHLSQAKTMIPDLVYREKFNNILWHKLPDGTPNAEGIRSYYKTYQQLSDEYIQEEINECNVDFILSDFVFEAFEIAQKLKKPAFGVAHFTWDWFFNKFYPPVISQDLIMKWMRMAESADMLFFPPFTPKEITNHYRNNAVQVPLIVRKHRKEIVANTPERKSVMLIDSGSAVNDIAIRELAVKLSHLEEYNFYLPKDPGFTAENIHVFQEGTFLLDHIGYMDLVVGRAGFNTISECISCRTPMLLFGEALNPEMQENIMFIKQLGLGSFTSLQLLVHNPGKILDQLFNGEYDVLKQNMLEHDIATNGAEIIANHIAEYVFD
jgi:uncharacterized protein (TIGR00661 family)